MTVAVSPKHPQIRREHARRARILRRAAQIVMERGWTAGSKGMPSSPIHIRKVCLLGAVEAALIEKEGHDPNRDSYQETASLVGTYSSAAYQWNDLLQHTSLNPDIRVAWVLRQLAKGIPWEEAKAQ